MAVAEQIQVYLERLPPASQAEVLNFVEYLLSKVERGESAQADRVWSELSVTAAIVGMENEDGPEYNLSDLKMVF